MGNPGFKARLIVELAPVPRFPDKPADLTEEQWEETLDKIKAMFHQGSRTVKVVYDSNWGRVEVFYPPSEVYYVGPADS